MRFLLACILCSLLITTIDAEAKKPDKKGGKPDKEQHENRLLLRNVMKEAGFMPITTEWWHFNSCYRKEAWEIYEIVE